MWDFHSITKYPGYVCSPKHLFYTPEIRPLLSIPPDRKIINMYKRMNSYFPKTSHAPTPLLADRNSYCYSHPLQFTSDLYEGSECLSECAQRGTGRDEVVVENTEISITLNHRAGIQEGNDILQESILLISASGCLELSDVKRSVSTSGISLSDVALESICVTTVIPMDSNSVNFTAAAVRDE